jgi:hypothetical protein
MHLNEYFFVSTPKLSYDSPPDFSAPAAPNRFRHLFPARLLIAAPVFPRLNVCATLRPSS